MNVLRQHFHFDAFFLFFLSLSLFCIAAEDEGRQCPSHFCSILSSSAQCKVVSLESPNPSRRSRRRATVSQSPECSPEQLWGSRCEDPQMRRWVFHAIRPTKSTSAAVGETNFRHRGAFGSRGSVSWHCRSQGGMDIRHVGRFLRESPC